MNESPADADQVPQAALSGTLLETANQRRAIRSHRGGLGYFCLSARRLKRGPRSTFLKMKSQPKPKLQMVEIFFDFFVFSSQLRFNVIVYTVVNYLSFAQMIDELKHTKYLFDLILHK